ncbi:hypothetical protein CP533_5604 [Ophiocordyceps camponoti-saundersi (nom. inval.)]|nr:hypothetical protein CP533_5604 [Ophiocordyceps camponoti-saundersi (nom. inval.)]
MASENLDPLASANLENRLRSLVLASNPPTDAQPSSDQSPRTSKRRPNQAERRQLSSQLSIPIDPRPLHQQAHYDFRHNPQQFNYSHHRNPPRPVNNNLQQQEGNSRIHFHQRPPYDPSSSQPHRRHGPNPGDIAAQAEFLGALCYRVVSQSEIDVAEIGEKETFRRHIETICRHVISSHEQQQHFPAESVELKCFGSLSSGFATKASDMDLGLLSPLSTPQPDAVDSPIPRLLEKAFLDAGLGARLLPRARVPIIKLCQRPSEPLRQSLVAERQKWESGEDSLADDLADDEHETASPGRGVQTSDDTVPNTASSSRTEAQDENGGGGCYQLQQGPDNSLSSYYALAKRVLRRAGGRDVTISNHREFTDSDWSILDGVCKAFVHGLSDSLLQKRLARYPSLSFQPIYKLPNHRSLFGVYTQVEGEQLVQLWDTWSAKEALQSFEAQTDQALATWNRIQLASTFGVDPPSFNRELQLALERIKLIPSFQLLLLEQGQNEDVTQYYARAKVILNSLRRASRCSSDAVQQLLVNQYVSGVAQKDLRNMLTKMVDNYNGQVDFEIVSLWHKGLHMSRQLEKAFKQGKLSASQAANATEYISLLQSSPCKILTGPADYKFVIPVPAEAVDLVMSMRALHSLVTVSSQSRDRNRDSLEFPTTGAGVQCDINFSAHLALQNTMLLRCYSYTDPRVRPMVLFVKHWAKVRGINSGYRGTLSSYGYVLMVLHYLVNVANPFVCPNLQHLAPPPPSNPSTAEIEATIRCRGCDIQFWRNEQQIMQLAAANQLNGNSEGIGHLLRGFFEYYAHNGIMSTGIAKGFDWGRHVLSLRTQGGLLTKQEKNWTGAKTVLEQQGGRTASIPQANPASSQEKALKKGAEVKEVRHRYLFAIEDPFELDHNVARTVTHYGIVLIRDEFRRAWRIINSVQGSRSQEELLQNAKDAQEEADPFLKLMEDIHGPVKTWMMMDRGSGTA